MLYARTPFGYVCHMLPKTDQDVLGRIDAACGRIRLSPVLGDKFMESPDRPLCKWCVAAMGEKPENAA